MAGLSDLLGYLDSKRRAVGRNLSDLMSNPAGYAEMMDDRAGQYNRNVQPVAQGGSLYERPLTEAEKEQQSIDMALNFGSMGAGSIRGAGFGPGGQSQIIDALERFAARNPTKKPPYVEPPYVPPVYSEADLALDAQLRATVEAKLARQRVLPDHRLRRPLNDLLDPRTD